MQKENGRIPGFWKWITIFFVFVLVLTFFSRTIYNLNLPTVTVSRAKQGSISHDISGEAYVSYKDTWNLYPIENGWIEKIFISNGDKVTKDQVLMTIKTQTGEPVDVLAPQNGVILTIGIKEGMYVMSTQNTVMCRMAAENKKWRANLEITEEQSAELTPGEEALIEISDLSGTISGKIENVLSSTSASGEVGYTAAVAFESASDIAGKQASVTIPKKSDAFDVIIPSYALHKDANGYYIFSLQESSGILGNQMIVRRVSVDLLDSDDTSVAIMGINASTLVIEAGTSEIRAGMQVLYEEESEE